MEYRTSAAFLAFAHGRCPSVLVKVRHDYGAALAGEADCGSAAHTTRRAGDYCNFIIESSHRYVLLRFPRCQMVKADSAAEAWRQTSRGSASAGLRKALEFQQLAGDA